MNGKLKFDRVTLSENYLSIIKVYFQPPEQKEYMKDLFIVKWTKT